MTVARFTVDGKRYPIVVVVEIGRDGWRGVTAFDAARQNDLDKHNVREGWLAYRRA